MQSMLKESIPSKGASGIEDRLSDLPDEVIVHILSFMTTLDAVRTILLRRFGNLWTWLPALRFNFEEFGTSFWPNAHKPESITFPCFPRFVRNVLMLHRSTIDIFHLSLIGFDGDLEHPEMVNDINMWLRIAIDKGVQDLSFVYDGLDVVDIPHFVFTSQSLATLTLCGCVVEQYEHQPLPNMGYLRKLSLDNVHGRKEALNQLICGCPSLQELYIDSTTGLEILNITAPSVQKLYLNLRDMVKHPFTLNCPSVKSLDVAVSENNLYVTGVSSLQEVYVMGLTYKCPSGLVKSFLVLFQNVEVFKLSIFAFKNIYHKNKMDFPRNRWKRLILQPYWGHKRCLDIIFELVKSSEKLEELVIYARQVRRHGNCKYPRPDISTCVMPLLKTVTIHGYEKCCKGQLPVIELLLRNAVVLGKMVITSGEIEVTEVEELDFAKQVLNFKRASVNATVVIA